MCHLALLKVRPMLLLLLPLVTPFSPSPDGISAKFSCVQPQQQQQQQHCQHSSKHRALFSLDISSSPSGDAESFTSDHKIVMTPNQKENRSGSDSPHLNPSRRSFFQTIGSAASTIASTTATFSVLTSLWNPSVVLAVSDDVEVLLAQVQQARTQLMKVPELIKGANWDGVRSILITPPLSDCWTTTASASSKGGPSGSSSGTSNVKKGSLLQQYAEAIGATPTGDELAVLEAKEDVTSSLRFLDMAVYNNIFNPIATTGEAGATKELIRSYNEDPINEYKASLKALEELIQLGTGL